MNFFEKVIEHLKNERTIFHSEDDLKLALAMTIAKLHPNWKIRLERPFPILMKTWDEKSKEVRAPIDIVLIDENNKNIPIEIKYKTKKFSSKEFADGDKYELANHGAYDAARYSFRKDIFRVETFLKTVNEADLGYVFILTNDSLYWETIINKKTIDRNFSFHNKAILSQVDLGWFYDDLHRNKYELNEGDKLWRNKDTNKIHWTSVKEYFYKIDLQRNYKIEWEHYSDVNGSNYKNIAVETEFKYCLIAINKNHTQT